MRAETFDDLVSTIFSLIRFDFDGILPPSLCYVLVSSTSVFKKVTFTRIVYSLKKRFILKILS